MDCKISEKNPYSRIDTPSQFIIRERNDLTKRVSDLEHRLSETMKNMAYIPYLTMV